MDPAKPQQPLVKNAFLTVLPYYVVGVMAIAAHISKYVGADVLSSVLAVLVMLSLTALTIRFVIRKSRADASNSAHKSAAYGVGLTILWNALWLIPVTLFIYGFMGDLLGFKEEGKVMGVIAVILAIAFLPTYLVLAIMRFVRRRKSKQLAQ
jgi:putative effector of murein hydrolase LrgA (UPF0299 family)